MIAQLSEGFLLGIATGTTCLATCGPIYAPYLMLSGSSLRSSLLVLLEISGGRFVTYLLVGLIAGLLSKSLNVLGDRTWFTAIAYIAFSLYLLYTALRTRRRKQCCQTSKWQAAMQRPLVLGLLTGINFCPSFLLAFTKAVSLSGPLAGMALFGAFFVGTSLFLLPLACFGVFGQKALFKRIAQVSAIGVAAWFIVQGVWSIYGLLSQNAQTVLDEKNVINVMDSVPSYIITDNAARQKTLQRVLASNRKGSVSIALPSSILPDRAYIFAFASNGDSVHTHNSPLRKAGRFVITLPAAMRDSVSENAARQIADFFTKFSFKTDPDSGSVFRLPLNAINEQ